MNYLSTVLQKTDSQDIDDMIEAIEYSFDIIFVERELSEINSIRALCNLICSKINFLQRDTCTTQQAFYKFRKAYYHTQNTTISLHTTSLLTDIFPKKQRRQNLAQIEKELGIKIHVLQPSTWISSALLLLFVGCIVLLLTSPMLAIVGLISTVTTYILMHKFASRFTIHSVKELITIIVKENYQKLRSSDTYNPKEIEPIVISYFKDQLGLDDTKFDQYATFKRHNF